IKNTAVGPGVLVRVVGIDHWRREHDARPPRLVMVDAEGAEINVLCGMRDTIVQHRPVILCEVHWIGSAFLAYCEKVLVPLGYCVTRLGGGDFPTTPQRFHALLMPEGRARLDAATPGNGLTKGHGVSDSDHHFCPVLPEHNRGE